MIQQMHSHREILRLNRALPDGLRQSSVVLQFATPVPYRHLWELRRIHLTPAMLSGGESDFHQPEIVQRHRVCRQVCTMCGGTLQRVAEYDYRCLNPHCRQESGRPTSTLIQGIEPHRGVVQVAKEFEAEHQGRRKTISFVAGVEHYRIGDRRRQDVICSGCLLVLDRRYHDAVLCAVYRTAGQVADEQGWRML